MSIEGAVATLGNLAGWHVRPLRSLVKQTKDLGHPELELLGVSLAHGVRPRWGEDGRPAASLDLGGYKRVRPGEIVMNALGKPHGSIGRSAQEGITSPAYWVLECSEHADSRFLHYLLRSNHMVNEYQRLGKYLPPNQFNISWDLFRDIAVPLPPLEEQRRIADFLDDQVSLMDKVVEMRIRQNGVSEELLQATLDKILSGTNQRVPIKHIATVRYGLGQPPPESESGVPIIRATNISRGTVTIPNLIFAKLQDLPLSRAPLLESGEILVVRSGALTGDSTIIRDEWAGASPGYDLRITPNRKVIFPDYLAWILLSRQVHQEISLLSSRAAQPHLNAEELGNLKVPMVSMSTQIETSSKLDEVQNKVRSAQSLMAQSRLGIGERKRALITAAVTGKLDVTSARPVSETELILNTDLGTHEGLQSSAGGIR